MPWQKGQSGNPKGRPTAAEAKKRLDVQELARQHTRPAIDALLEVVQDKAAPHSARVSAAGTILDRGWGRAPQEIKHTGDFESMVLEMVRTLDTARAAADAMPDAEAFPNSDLGETRH